MKACVVGLQNECKMLPRSLIEPISQEHGTQALLLGAIVLNGMKYELSNTMKTQFRMCSQIFKKFYFDFIDFNFL